MVVYNITSICENKSHFKKWSHFRGFAETPERINAGKIILIRVHGMTSVTAVTLLIQTVKDKKEFILCITDSS